MIQSGAIVRPPYIYGEILSRSLYQSPLYELPGFGRCLSQGIVVGAFISFLWPVIGMLSYPKNGYNFLLIFGLPVFLAIGMGFGLFEGGLIWACSYIAGHRLNALARAGGGIVIMAILLVVYTYFLPDQPGNYEASLWGLIFIAVYSAVGVVFGLVSGSMFSPMNELLRGTTPPRRLVLNGITGFLLRVLVIYATMESTLTLIWMTQLERPDHREFVFAVIALSHCIAATVIVFTRMPFWLLLLLALLINFPVVVLITDVLTNEIARSAVIVYLTLWTAFLLCRVSVPHAVLSSVKKEIRYYLID